jgi:ubiquitin C-terminal hydrolase
MSNLYLSFRVEHHILLLCYDCGIVEYSPLVLDLQLIYVLVSGKVLGLVNLGYTCFLNTLLQALASCPVVLDWLSKYQNGAERNSFTATLQNTLQGK